MSSTLTVRERGRERVRETQREGVSQTQSVIHCGQCGRQCGSLGARLDIGPQLPARGVPTSRSAESQLQQMQQSPLTD